MSLTDLVIPPWVRWLAGALAAAALIAAGVEAKHRYDAGQQAIGEARVQAKWDKADRDRAETERLERARLDRQKEESDRETRRFLEQAQDARAVADAAAGKLRGQLAAYVAAAKRASPPSVGISPPADTALDLLFDLFGRADATAGELAEYADRARIAGQQCERDYDALKAR